MATPVLRLGDGPGGNYLVKIMELCEQHPEILAGVRHVSISHDSWCGIYKGRPCNCNVEVKLMEVQ
jgi:hypothetical protein